MSIAITEHQTARKRPPRRYAATPGMPFGVERSADPVSNLALGSALDFTMAFQPIVDIETRSVFAYEALLRGRQHQPAREMLNRVAGEHLYTFDKSCQVRAIEMAVQLGILRSGASISINCMPGAIECPDTCIRTTLAAAARVRLPMGRIIFEMTEEERVTDRARLKAIFKEYRRQGLRTAIDDFGAGYAGLTLLADFQPDVVKIDRALIDGIDRNRAARSIVAAIVQVCNGLQITVVAEGIEKPLEALVLADLGVRYMQGYLFARPAFEALGEPRYEAMSA